MASWCSVSDHRRILAIFLVITAGLLSTCGPAKDDDCQPWTTYPPETSLPLTHAYDDPDTAAWPLPEDMQLQVVGGELTITYTSASGAPVTVRYEIVPAEDPCPE